MPGHLSPPQPGGGIMQEETDTEDVKANRHINTIFDKKLKLSWTRKDCSPNKGKNLIKTTGKLHHLKNTS
jgi:hypothetical protein